MSEETPGPRLSPDEQRALSSVLDEIIPPSEDGELPGAGELGLSSYLEQALQQTPGLLAATIGRLAALDDLAHSRGARRLAALSRQDKLAVLEEHAAADPGFLPGLIFHTYVGYYKNGRVVEALGLEHRPPHPDGHDLAPFDTALLDGVRRRTKLYRE